MSNGGTGGKAYLMELAVTGQSDIGAGCYLARIIFILLGWLDFDVSHRFQTLRFGEYKDDMETFERS